MTAAEAAIDAAAMWTGILPGAPLLAHCHGFRHSSVFFATLVHVECDAEGRPQLLMVKLADDRVVLMDLSAASPISRNLVGSCRIAAAGGRA